MAAYEKAGESDEWTKSQNRRVTMIVHKDFGPRTWRERPAFLWEQVKFNAELWLNKQSRKRARYGDD